MAKLRPKKNVQMFKRTLAQFSSFSIDGGLIICSVERNVVRY